MQFFIWLKFYSQQTPHASYTIINIKNIFVILKKKDSNIYSNKFSTWIFHMFGVNVVLLYNLNMTFSSDSCISQINHSAKNLFFFCRHSVLYKPWPQWHSIFGPGHIELSQGALEFISLDNINM